MTSKGQYASNREYYKAIHKAYCESHKEELRIRRKAYWEVHKEGAKVRTAIYSANIKKLVFDHYGGKCRCCGELELSFLYIDHINGGGTAHRKEIGGGSAIYHWLIANNYPEGFQILCANCNQAKTIKGVCPHQISNFEQENNCGPSSS